MLLLVLGESGEEDWSSMFELESPILDNIYSAKKSINKKI